MSVEYSEHARRKILQRSIKKTWIEKTVQSPEYVIKSYGNREIAYKKIGKLHLAVVFIKEEGKTVIITTHWEKGFKPIQKEN